MKKFVVLYTSPMSSEEQMKNMSPEQMKAGMDMWYAWAKKHEAAVVDLGNPLGNAHNVAASGATPAETWTRGYSIMQSESIEEVSSCLAEHPHLSVDGNGIQVLEVFPMM
jgi:hypothetical protein